MPASDPVITAALEQIEQGFAVFALKADAKVPVTEHGFKNATTRPDWIRKQLAAPAAGNYGLIWPADSRERVVVFDLDDGGGADRPWRDRMLDLVAAHGPLPPTKITNTPSGGRHAFYRWPDDVPVPAGDELFGFTVRWPGRGYLVGPGSRIGDVQYTAGPVREIALLPAPWVEAAATSGRSPADAGEITFSDGYVLPERIPSGRRYAAVRDYVASRYNAGLGLAELWDLVRTQVAPRFAQPKTDQELRSDFDRVTAKLVERLGPPAAAKRAQPAKPRTQDEIAASSIDAADLLELDIPELQWIVPQLLPEGTTVLAGPPKLGKSCLVYQVAVEVALGGELLNRDIEQGDVLYLALEDGKRRGQTRLRAALGDRSMPRGRLEVRWSAAKLGEGLEEELVTWLTEHPNARLVAIDTLQRVRAKGDARRNAYEVDVEDLARLQDIFKDRAVGLLIVHHSKKDAGDDFLASVSGTYGITGSADTTLVIQRKRLETFGKLVVTGRDVEEIEEAVQFNGMTWTAAPRSLAEASFERAEVYKVIETRGPIMPVDIARELGEDPGTGRNRIKYLVAEMVKTGSIARQTGGYVIAGFELVEDGEVGEEAEMASIATSPTSGPRGRAHAGRTPTSPTSPTYDSDQEVGQAGGTRTTRGGARETGLRVLAGGTSTVTCSAYAEHQSEHYRAADGWRCRICSPEEGTPS